MSWKRVHNSRVTDTMAWITSMDCVAVQQYKDGEEYTVIGYRPK